MSFQRPNNIQGPSSASYSEFLKDIYSSLRLLSTGLATINTRLDTFAQQLQSFDARLAQQDLHAQNLSDRLDTLIQRTENTQIRQTTASVSLLSELDSLGARQVEPSTGLAELGTRVDKPISSTGLFSKLSFQLPPISELSDIPELSESTYMLTPPQQQQQQLKVPDIIIHESSTGLQTNEPSTEASKYAEPVTAQLGTNFLILD